MKPFPGLGAQTEQDPIRRQKWALLDWWLRDLSFAMQRIEQGEVPNGSGAPIGDQTLSDIYLVLNGRPGNQMAHGGTLPGGSLTLASTLNPTKGLIYLGDSQGSAWDETNSRLGIGTVNATAKVHIKVGAALPQTSLPTTDSGTPGVDWSKVGGSGTYASTLADSSDATYIRFDEGFGVTSNIVNLSMPSNPGVTTGWQLKLRIAATMGAMTKFVMGVSITNNPGSTWLSRTFGAPGSSNTGTEGNVTSSLADYTINITSVEAANALFTGGWQLAFRLNDDSAPFTGGQFTISKAKLEVPVVGGGLAADTLQKWEDPTYSMRLDFASDGGSGEAMKLDGTTKFMVASGVPLIFATAGSTNDIWARQDSLGTGAWANATAVVSAVASALPTKVLWSWEANGPFRPGAEIDGVRQATSAQTISRVVLYRRAAGTGGTTTVDLLKNGVSVLTAPVGIGATGGASASAAGTLATTTVALNDFLSASGVANETGVPQDWALNVMGF